MDAREYILIKQLAWAQERGTALVGSQGDRGRKVYAKALEENLFVPLDDGARASFAAGDGGELGTASKVGKMQALHSSSAIGVNVFNYWRSIGDASTIAAACGLCKSGSDAPRAIVFEEKYPIFDDAVSAPNVDVVIKNKPGSAISCYGIECKFTEAYSSYAHGGMKDKYFEQGGSLWDGIPGLLALAKELNPDDKHFKHLHAAQLIKHTLGLKRAYGKAGFRLLYLWYDALGDAATLHRKEVQEFTQIMKSDKIMFHAMTYQELILALERTLADAHRPYAHYLANRYL